MAVVLFDESLAAVEDGSHRTGIRFGHSGALVVGLLQHEELSEIGPLEDGQC